MSKRNIVMLVLVLITAVGFGVLIWVYPPAFLAASDAVGEITPAPTKIPVPTHYTPIPKITIKPTSAATGEVVDDVSNTVAPMEAVTEKPVRKTSKPATSTINPTVQKTQEPSAAPTIIITAEPTPTPTPTPEPTPDMEALRQNNANRIAVLRRNLNEQLDYFEGIKQEYENEQLKRGGGFSSWVWESYNMDEVTENIEILETGIEYLDYLEAQNESADSYEELMEISNKIAEFE